MEQPRTLLELPPELLHQALSSADPVDVAAFSATCTDAHQLGTTPALAKSLFLNTFDPLPASDALSLDYAESLHARIRARNMLQSIEKRQEDGEPHDGLDVAALQALVDVADSRPTRRASTLPELTSLNELFLEQHIPSRLLPLQPLSGRLRPRPRLAHEQQDLDPQQRQLYAQLHCLQTPTSLTLHSQLHRTAARELVYEYTSYLRKSHWGPFMADGKLNVDWIKVEALAVVMGANLGEASSLGWGDDTVVPVGWKSTRRGAAGEEEGRDWAGVGEEWRGTYCFLDYRAYEHYNFHRSSTFRPTLEGESEAVGDCMVIKLNLLPPGEISVPPGGVMPNGNNDDDEDEEEDPDYDSDDDSEDSDFSMASEGPLPASSSSPVEVESPPSSIVEGENDEPSKSPSPSHIDNETTPPLSFIGTSERLHFQGSFLSQGPPSGGQPNRSIRGTVRRTKEGMVHWEYVIRYSGADQWLMNGVQVGGPRSRFGVLGIWSTVSHDDGGPHGPFHYWPTS